MDGPLTTCPICRSRLIYPVGAWRRSDTGAVVARRCPECEHRGVVLAGLEATRQWVRRQQRIRSELIRAMVDLEVDSGPA